MADGPQDGKGHRLRGISGESLAATLSRALHRLSWKTPLHNMRLRGRYPLQLIDVPADPIPGRPRAGRALLEGRMLFGQESVAIDALPRGGFSPAFADHLQSFAWLRDLAAAAPREQAAPVAEALTRAWLEKHAASVTDGWRPDLWGRRILFWTAHAPYMLGSSDQEYRKAVLNTLARGARHLDRAADSVPQGVGRVAAWAGVIAAGLLIPGGDLRTAHGEAGMARALGAALDADGGLLTRLPIAQLDLIETLAQLRAAYEVRARPLPAAIAKAVAQAVPPLLGTMLGDGGLSSWQGGGPSDPVRIEAAVVANGGIRAEPLAAPRQWGYQRLAGGPVRLVMDAAPPPAGALVKGGCASTLAFEMSEGVHRLIVNCGGGSGLAAELAQGLRTTAAHSTLVLADTNSTALHDDGSLGKGVAEVTLERREAGGSASIEGSHDGYVRRYGFRHARRLTLSGDGRQLSGEDKLIPSGRKRGLAATPFAIHFHLAPGLDPVLTADGRGVLLKPAEGEAWQFRTDGPVLALEDSLWIDPLGRPRPTKALLVKGETPPDGIAVGWSLRKVR